MIIRCFAWSSVFGATGDVFAASRRMFRTRDVCPIRWTLFARLIRYPVTPATVRQTVRRAGFTRVRAARSFVVVVGGTGGRG